MKTNTMIDPLASLRKSMKYIKVLSVHSRGDKAMVSFVGKSGASYTRHVPLSDVKIIKGSLGANFVLGLSND